MNYEVHPGLYTAYEFSDNYFGTAQDQESESTYEVGPSLSLTGESPTFRGDLTAHLAKSYHQEFKGDESTEAEIISNALFSQEHQSLSLTYEYLQTRWRGSLAEPTGLLKRNSGGIGYTREITRRATLSLGYDITDDNWQQRNEDVLSQGANIQLAYLLTPRDTVNLTTRYDDYDYGRSEDVTVTDATVTSADVIWLHAVTSKLRLGISSSYVNQDRGSFANEEAYNLSATGSYAIAQHTSITATGGYSWLVIEHQDRQNIYTTSASLEHVADQDRFIFNVSKGYAARFTTDLYGIYDTRSASLTWQKGLLKTLTGEAEIAVEQTKPTPGATGEKETDAVARASLVWNPIRYATATATYEHLQHEYEISDTVRENRYRMVVEVRY